MPQGGRLRLGARVRELESDFASQYIATGSGGTFVEFWVQDDGHGMDEETQRRIFEPFFTTKEAGVGTGLGLPVVFGAFLDADGGVVVESSPGEGTIFRAYLPLLEVPGDLEPVVRHPEPAVSLQVLVVDDNADVLRTTQRLLERLGHKVTSTHEPVKALELAKTQNYDLLLIDVIMPEMGGVEFTRRYFAAGLSSRVVLVSGYSEEQEELKTLAVEFGVGFLAKPFTRADLRAAIVV
jgi:CheY-like chemotaxis protein